MRNWDKIYKVKGEVQKEPLKEIVKIVPYFKGNRVKKILDLGCGTGRHTIFLAKKGFDVTATDISKNGLKVLNEKLRKIKMKNVKTKRHDMSSIPFQDNYFDAVICTGVLPHGKIKKIRKTIKEVHRVLKNNGIFFLTVLSLKDSDYLMGKTNPQKYKEIEPDTFLGLEEEENCPHHFFSRYEIIKLLYDFKIITLKHRTECTSYKIRKNKCIGFGLLAKCIK